MLRRIMESNFFLSPIPLDQLEAMFQNIVRQEIRLKQTEDLQEKLLSPKETAKLFTPKVSLVTLDSWTAKGFIRKHHIGGRVYYRYKEIIEAIEKIKPYMRTKKVA